MHALHGAQPSMHPIRVARPAAAQPLSGGNAWHLIGATNFHMTNMPQQMALALESPADWFEGDIRMTRRGPVMAHLASDIGFGFTTSEWLSLVAQSGRSMKMDFKDSAAIAPTIRMIRSLNIPDHRLMFNITVTGRSRAHVSAHMAADIRRQFPGSVITLSTEHTTYEPALIRQMAIMAHALGGRTQVILRWDRVTTELIRIVQHYTNLAIWNVSFLGSPRDIAAETARLRGLGVTGVIDLR